jgi:hypothetical protein
LRWSREVGAAAVAIAELERADAGLSLEAIAMRADSSSGVASPIGTARIADSGDAEATRIARSIRKAMIATVASAAAAT